MESKKLFLLDAYALIFRAYYALIKAPRFNRSGMNTSAIFGFVNSLEELLRKENPTHIAVCFDPSGPTFRHDAFEAYKGEREATPEDIKLSIPIIKEIIAAYRIPILEKEGFEADDVIGTMARRAETEGFVTYMMTPDKDFGQLVTDKILQYKPSYRGQDFEIRGPQEVCERYRLKNPSQVIDLLALMGDKADNIPGCPGVGEKTAEKLIGEFGSIENLISESSKLKGALRGKIENNVEQIRFSKFLATICTDVPIDAQPSDLVRRDADTNALFALFEKLDFRSLIERVSRRIKNSSNTSAEEKPTILKSSTTSLQPSLFDDMTDDDTYTSSDTVPSELIGDYVIVTSPEQLAEIENSCREAGTIGVAVLSSGESDVSSVPWGIAFSISDGNGWYVPFSIDGASALGGRIYDDISLLKISPDVKRDYVVLTQLGVDTNIKNYYDAGVAHYLIEPERRHTLPEMALTILDIKLSFPTVDIPRRRGPIDTLSLLSEEQRGEYACKRADISRRLFSHLSEGIKTEGMETLLYDIELPLVRVLADMEIAGVRIDVSALNEAADDLRHRLEDVESEIFRLAGDVFNVGSPAKVGEILFDRLGLEPRPKKTRTGQYSTGEEILEKLAGTHPIVAHILQYRKLKKLLNTYLTALPECINPLTGKIHTMYNQTVTATGRISSSDPNLQNIPVRDDIGREIRRAFIPDPGHLFLSADYSQIELRLVADFAGDETMIDAFAHDKDIHAITASKIYKERLEDITKQQRRAAKTANFGILYGISAFGLASRLSIPRSEAKALIDGYFTTFPAVHRYMSESIERAREKGYVETIKGRRRSLPDINSRNAVVRGYAERNAINAPIQGSAADIIKIAMVDIDKEIRRLGLKSRLIMQVHDELNFDVLPDELEVLRDIVNNCMEGAYIGRVKMEATIGIGPDWLSAH